MMNSILKSKWKMSRLTNIDSSDMDSHSDGIEMTETDKRSLMSGLTQDRAKAFATPLFLSEMKESIENLGIQFLLEISIWKKVN